MIDWTLAERVARRRRRLAERRDREAAARRPRRDGAATRARASSPTRASSPPATLPPPEAVDRAAWATANLRTMRGTLDPLVEQVGERQRARSPGRCAPRGGMLARGARSAAIVGFIGRRVLGQYELALLDPTRAPRLLFVAPNLARGRATAWTSTLEELLPLGRLPRGHPRRAVHGVPWLREHLAGLLRELLVVGAGQGRRRRALLKLPTRRRPARAVATRSATAGSSPRSPAPSASALLDRLQATMALIEGHAEHVMDAVGAPVLPNVATAARRRWTAAAATARRCSSCSSACSAST